MPAPNRCRRVITNRGTDPALTQFVGYRRRRCSWRPGESAQLPQVLKPGTYIRSDSPATVDPVRDGKLCTSPNPAVCKASWSSSSV